MDHVIDETEALDRLHAWKNWWRRGGEAPAYTEPREVRQPWGMQWHSHDRREGSRERRYWPVCGCEVEEGVPPLPEEGGRLS